MYRAQGASDPMEISQTIKKYILKSPHLPLTSPYKHLIWANFAFIYNQEFWMKACLVTVTLEN